MNRENMLTLADRIDEAVGGFDLSGWLDYGDHEEYDVHPGTCGTTACIAGWANYVIAGRAIDEMEASDQWQAAAWLGLDTDNDPDAYRRLFYDSEVSIWYRQAEHYGWATNKGAGLADWSAVTNTQAADVLRRIAQGAITL